jgi:S1-C subfamily serine protease
MKRLILLLLFLPLFAFSQKNLSQDAVIKRWKNSVMNLECTRNRFSYDQVQQIINNIKTDPAKKYSQDDLSKIEHQLQSTDETITGTAVLVSDGKLRYLITAKHVLIANSPYYRSSQENISTRISITTNIDAYNNKQLNDAMAMNLSAGPSSIRPFIFSQNDIDLGIISLQSDATKDLLEVIIKDGLQPIPINSIDTLNDHKEGELITALGFPSLSLIAQAQHPNKRLFQSSLIVSPVVTFGNIAMIHPILNYFIGDITVYPGNSGGPIVNNNKLIGIVSEQLSLKVETDLQNLIDISDHITTRGTLAKIIKASNIMKLLRQMQEKEKMPYFH